MSELRNKINKVVRSYSLSACEELEAHDRLIDELANAVQKLLDKKTTEIEDLKKEITLLKKQLK
jgi:hypothetical protein